MVSNPFQPQLAKALNLSLATEPENLLSYPQILSVLQTHHDTLFQMFLAHLETGNTPLSNQQKKYCSAFLKSHWANLFNPETQFSPAVDVERIYLLLTSNQVAVYDFIAFYEKALQYLETVLDSKHAHVLESVTKAFYGEMNQLIQHYVENKLRHVYPIISSAH